jgi:uncharacterized protein YbaA (DUF1428 family)
VLYAAIYVYVVPCENVARFLEIQREAAEICLRYGAIDDLTFAPTNLDAKYGCSPFGGVVPLQPSERLFISVGKFRDRAHHDEVMTRVDRDPRINELNYEIVRLLDVSRITRGEFQRIV